MISLFMLVESMSCQIKRITGTQALPGIDVLSRLLELAGTTASPEIKKPIEVIKFSPEALKASSKTREELHNALLSGSHSVRGSFGKKLIISIVLIELLFKA